MTDLMVNQFGNRKNGNKIECIKTILFLMTFFLVASSVALMQPLENTPPIYANAPDEHARYLVPRYICEHGTLPNGYDEEVRIPGYGSSYALYNVLPYIFMGYLMRWVHWFTDSKLALLYCARFVNVFFGTIMAFTIRRLSLRVFDDKARKIHLDWLFCFFVMFLPQHLFLHTYVNTDSMAMLSTALIVYALVSIYQDGFDLRKSAILCVGVIFCALSYYNAYSYILSAIFLCLFYFLKRGENGKLVYDWKQMLRVAIPIILVITLGTGWWFLRNFLLYDGDIFGLRTARQLKELYAVDSVNPLTSQTYRQMGYTPWQMMKERDFLSVQFASFIGVYGSETIPANVWIYRIYKIFLYSGVIGFILTIPRYWKGKNGKRMFFHGNLVFCILMTMFLSIYYAFASDYQAQGRYVMPILVPLMLYVVKGMERIMCFLLIGEHEKDGASADEKPAYLLKIMKKDEEAIKKIGRKVALVCTILTMVVILFLLFWMVYGIAMPIYVQVQPVIL